MSPSELAFLALGLLLGIASGAAIVVVFNSHPPTHEIRVTMARDAIPRRASTLAEQSAAGGTAWPAPGGPGDRRVSDRESGPGDDRDRTIVRSPVPIVVAPSLPWLLARQPEALAARPASIAIEPERDSILAALGIAEPGTRIDEPDDGTILPALLDRDHRATMRLVDAVAGPDDEQRRTWDALIGRFVGAVRERALELGFIDLPMGNPFWDTFTVDQCREIALALASTGRRFDGRSGWADGLVPTYRDLSRALADSGLDPRRIRAWPNSQEIAELFRGASIAAAEAVAQWAPTLEADDLRRFLDDGGGGLDELWSVWDVVVTAMEPRPSEVIESSLS
ncbi:MAG TPA: hypothetical protein VFW86_07045 [Candidatus Limnocylindrales bacterium]|nr:hypothetical protein [Candidatus Limnocylindrales bacterium]